LHYLKVLEKKQQILRNHWTARKTLTILI